MGKEPHRIALVGAGRIGQIHFASTQARPTSGWTWPGWSSRGRTWRRNWREGWAGGIATWEQALADPALAGVIVASSTDTHLEVTLAALRAGKAVFCEKPLDLDLARLRAHEAELRAAQAPSCSSPSTAGSIRTSRSLQGPARRRGGGRGGEPEHHQPRRHAAARRLRGRPAAALFRDMAIHDLDGGPLAAGRGFVGGVRLGQLPSSIRPSARRGTWTPRGSC